MRVGNDIFSADGEVSEDQTRAPLAPRTAIPSNIPTKHVRRKGSLVFRQDSSEEAPSSHTSIFEALYTSPNNSDESNNEIELASLRHHGLKLDVVGNNENLKNDEGQTSPPSDNTQFRYGHGTVLQTITEQKSFATIATLTRTKSVDHMPSFPFLRHRDSFVLNQTPRRKQSFSLDDLALIKTSYHDACSTIEREIQKPLIINEIYAQPKSPPHKPIQRPPTPEGLPSWTASQNIPRPTGNSNRRATNINRLQRFFGFPASGRSSSSQSGLSSHRSIRSVSAPTLSRLAPRFRPPRSAYGPIDQHPFNNAPRATVQPPVTGRAPVEQALKPSGKRKLGLRVRFTSSATARDSEALALQTAMDATRVAAIHPITPIETVPIDELPRLELQARCSHRKGKKAEVGMLRGNKRHTSKVPRSNEYVVLSTDLTLPEEPGAISHSPVSTTPTRPVSSLSAIDDDLAIIDIPSSRPVSVSSATHLMSGALLSPLPYPDSDIPRQHSLNTQVRPREKPPKVKSFSCWKCKLEAMQLTLDHWWCQTVSCLCFVCCGYDIDDGMSYVGDVGGTSLYGATLRGGGYNERCGPRRVNLPPAARGL